MKSLAMWTRKLLLLLLLELMMRIVGNGRQVGRG
jgi:hypothetical protein